MLTEEGILHCRGRLQHSKLPYSQKFPALLPSDSYVTELIIQQCHECVFHNKTRETLNELRSHYWVPRARQKVRKIIYKCVTCRRFEGQLYVTPVMAPLPEFRLDSEVPAFQTVVPNIKVGRNKSHFTSDPLNGDNKYTANDICKMIEFLVDNIYVRFGGQLFRQTVGIPMGTNCAPLLADLFLYSYENEFLDKLIKEGKRKLARRFNLSYRYIDDLISFNNKRFKEFISDIYPKELTISETTESTSVASYLDLLFTRDRSNNITTKL